MAISFFSLSRYFALSFIFAYSSFVNLMLPSGFFKSLSERPRGSTLTFLIRQHLQIITRVPARRRNPTKMALHLMRSKYFPLVNFSQAVSYLASTSSV